MLRCCELTQAERDKGRDRGGREPMVKEIKGEIEKASERRRGRELMKKESEDMWRGARCELRGGGVPRG